MACGKHCRTVVAVLPYLQGCRVHASAGDEDDAGWCGAAQHARQAAREGEGTQGVGGEGDLVPVCAQLPLVHLDSRQWGQPVGMPMDVGYCTYHAQTCAHQRHSS